MDPIYFAAITAIVYAVGSTVILHVASHRRDVKEALERARKSTDETDCHIGTREIGTSSPLIVETPFENAVYQYVVARDSVLNSLGEIDDADPDETPLPAEYARIAHQVRSDEIIHAYTLPEVRELAEALRDTAKGRTGRVRVRLRREGDSGMIQDLPTPTSMALSEAASRLQAFAAARELVAQRLQALHVVKRLTDNH